jgi:hypothetical protein
MNLPHALTSYLSYLHFYAGICQAVYAQPLIIFTTAILDADIHKIASTCNMLMNESQLWCPVQFLTYQFRSHIKNDYDRATICWVYKTLPEVPGNSIERCVHFTASGAAEEN